MRVVENFFKSTIQVCDGDDDDASGERERTKSVWRVLGDNIQWNNLKVCALRYTSV